MTTPVQKTICKNKLVHIMLLYLDKISYFYISSYNMLTMLIAREATDIKIYILTTSISTANEMSERERPFSTYPSSHCVSNSLCSVICRSYLSSSKCKYNNTKIITCSNIIITCLLQMNWFHHQLHHF